MKNPKDPRHLKRREAIKKLFAQSFVAQETSNKTQKMILEKLPKIDAYIKEAAPEWPIEKINKVDLAILRLAVFELKVAKKEPPKVIIDEAIELAKEFGAEASPAFVNGALGKILKDEKQN